MPKVLTLILDSVITFSILVRFPKFLQYFKWGTEQFILCANLLKSAKRNREKMKKKNFNFLNITYAGIKSTSHDSPILAVVENVICFYKGSPDVKI